MRSISIACSVILSLILCLASNVTKAAPVVVDYSFSNTVGNVPGTVSWRAFGLDNAVVGDQAASSIVITGFPAGLPGVFDEGVDAVQWTPSGLFRNRFVFNGGNLDIITVVIKNDIIDYLASINMGAGIFVPPLGPPINNYLSRDSHVSYVATNDAANINVSVVPLPGAVWLLGSGIVALFAGKSWQRRRRLALQAA